MTKRRGHDEGSIYWDASANRWIAALSVRDEFDGTRRRVKRRARTKTEARAKLSELKKQHERGGLNAEANMTVAQLLELLLEKVKGKEPRRSPNTIDNYRWAIDGHLAPALGRTRVTDLTVDKVERFLISRRDEGLSSSSLRRLKSVLAAALRIAQARGVVVLNVAQLSDVPPSHTRLRRSLTADQASTLMDAAQGHWLELALYIGISRGLRPGEILGLRWSDIDLERTPPVMRVNRALKREHGQLRLGEPKTLRSIRSLVVPEPAVEMLRAHRSQQSRQRLACRSWAANDLVFCTATGTMIDPSNFRREFKALTRAAGLGDWAPYELRHSAFSLLSAAGVPVEQLADLGGHNDTRMVMQVYRHPLTPAVDAGADALSDILSDRPTADENLR